MDGSIAHSGWLLKRGGLPFRRWEKRFFALVTRSTLPALFFKASASDAAAWLGVLPLSDGASCGALARGEAHPEAACFCALRYRYPPLSPALLTAPRAADVHRLGRTYVLAAGSESTWAGGGLLAHHANAHQLAVPAAEASRWLTALADGATAARLAARAV